MKVNLIDNNQEMVNAWNVTFEEFENVNIFCGDYFSLPTKCITSPANSFGFMDGGLDFAITKRFGWDLMKRVQNRIINEFNGELLIGQAFVIETNDSEIPFCMIAPTMRVPEFVPNSVNAYLAMKAIIIEVRKYPEIDSITISGLCTGVGAMPFEQSATQMALAYTDFALGRFKYPKSWSEAKYKHMILNGWKPNLNS